MRDLSVSVEILGEQVPVGILLREEGEEGRFCYDESYLSGKGGLPISRSLPFQKAPFSSEATRTFFEGLLPEGFTRRSVAQHLQKSENDYLSLLEALGNECLGAIRIVPKNTGGRQENMEICAYRPVSSEEVRELAREGASKSAEIVISSHLSLTGASGKAGLYYDEENNRWYQPEGLASSSHIVKQSHVRLEGIVTNERLCMAAAGRLGIEVPDSFILNLGNGTDSDILFVTKRYDRIITEDSKTVSTLLMPLRLHQEDFGQAMGIPASAKYEPPGGHYLADMFRLLRSAVRDPLQDQMRLWKMIVFNVLIGNNDGHIKNFSLLYDAPVQTMRLAPAYDMLSTAIYRESTNELSFSIGGERKLPLIRRDHFVTATSEAGIGHRLAIKALDDMCQALPAALRASAEDLEKEGFRNAGETCEKILDHGGIRYL